MKTATLRPTISYHRTDEYFYTFTIRRDEGEFKTDYMNKEDAKAYYIMLHDEMADFDCFVCDASGYLDMITFDHFTKRY